MNFSQHHKYSNMFIELNFTVEETFGLEKIGGLRELEDLRGPFIIPARN